MKAPAHILSWLVWLPIAASAVVLLLGDRRIVLGTLGRARRDAGDARPVRAAVEAFDLATPALQFVEREPWIGAVNAWYHLGIDGISLPLIVLTAFTTPLVVVAAWSGIEKRPAQYFASFLVMEGPDDRRVRGGGRAPLLRVLGGDADPDVPHHRDLGRRAARVRHDQVLPVHVPRLGADAGRADLAVSPGRQLRDRGHAAHAGRDDGAGPRSSWRSSRHSRSRSRCGRSTPGCRTPTSRRRPAGR